MRLQFVTVLSQPREVVWSAFDNFDNLRKWQPGIVEVTPLSGTPGQPGALTRIVNDEDGLRIELTETITERHEQELLATSYESTHGRNSAVNRFSDVPGGTQWEIDAEFAFTGAARFLAGMLKGRISRRMQDDMERFKRLLDAGELAT